MILLIDKKSKNVKEVIEDSKFSKLGIWERQHIEEWIAEYPQILGEELLTVTTEYAKFDKTSNRLDVLAVDSNGKLVIIEIKRDVADKFVDLQAIHYAAYCSTLNKDEIINIMLDYKYNSREAAESRLDEMIMVDDFSDFDNQPRIMLVANDFREETLAAVLWLRDSGIDITCVKLEPYEIGENIVVNSEIIIPLPEAKDYMIKVEKKKQIKPELSALQRRFYEFWSKVLNDFKDKMPGVTDREPRIYNILNMLTGYGNVHFEWLIVGRPMNELQVALHFERGKKEENLKLLEYFKKFNNKIENEFNDEEVIFDGDWGNIWARIYIKRDISDLNDEDVAWASETMGRLYKILRPILDEYYS